MKNIEVIAQIDKKFIVGKLRNTESKDCVLIAIDQHALSERINLEQLIAMFNN